MIDPVTLLLIALAFGVAHALIIFAILGATFLPNPISQIQNHGPPERWGLSPERTIVGQASPAWYFPHPSEETAVLICHGRSRSKNWMLPLIAAVARTNPVLAIDFPSHGEHRYGLTTIGLRESDTVTAGAEWLRRRGHGSIVVYGVSMGGAASVIATGRDAPPAVVGLVTDGAFDELTSVIDNITRRLPVPAYLHRAAYWIAKRVVGSEPADVRPVAYAPSIRVPALFLHGDRDRLVPPACAEALAAAAPTGRAQRYEGGHDRPDNQAMQHLVLEFVARLSEEH